LAKEAEAEQRRQTKRRASKQTPQKKPRRQANLIALELPPSAAAGRPVVVKLRHTLPEELGEQSVHLTLKAGMAGQRVERKVIKVCGTGVEEVTFDVPATVLDNVISFAAFVGEDYQTNLQHLQTSRLAAQ
jgi:hypothetical protein